MDPSKLAYSRRDPFKTPEGYFKALERQVMRKIDDMENGDSRARRPARAVRRPMLRYLLPLTEMAAAIALVSIVAYNAIGTSGTPGGGMLETRLGEGHPEGSADAAYEYLMLDTETIYDYATDDY